VSVDLQKSPFFRSWETDVTAAHGNNN
jgi:hypothetical protein